MSFNQRALYDMDNRYAFSGKDTSIFDGDGNLLSTVESWQAQVTFNNATYQALGAAIQQEFMTSYAVTIAVTQFIIEDDDFIRQMVDFFEHNRHAPTWTLASTIHGYNDTESRLQFIDCVPTGQVDLHNFTVGDIVRRTLNFHVNQPPNLQKILSVPN